MIFLMKCVLLLLTFYWNCHDCSVDVEYDVSDMPKTVHRRQDAIAMLTVNGSHFECGYMIGRTFAAVIVDFVNKYEPLVKYLEDYATVEGKKIYTDILDQVQRYCPQYLFELKGVATGSGVRFHVLFLIHIDDIMPNNMPPKFAADKNPGTGCTSLMVNRGLGHSFLGHNEDALKVTTNRYYIISARIVPDPRECGGKLKCKIEIWEALTYAGSLSGYASGNNIFGVAFSVNTIFAVKTPPNKIPRVFLTRAILGAEADITEIKDILTNKEFGVSDAFHLNTIIIDKNDGSKSKFYSIEVTPSYTKPESELYVEEVKLGTTTLHVNRLHEHATCPELQETGWFSSLAREKRYCELVDQYGPVQDETGILRILSDSELGEWQTFRDFKKDFVQTINSGIMDFTLSTWTFWTNRETYSGSMLTIPLVFANPKFVSPLICPLPFEAYNEGSFDDP